MAGRYRRSIRAGARRLLPAWLGALLLAWVQAVAAAEPLRIITLAPGLAELVYAAGAGEQLVGVVEYSDYPAAVLELPQVGDSFRVDYEVIRRLAPDVILSWESGNPREIVERLRVLGYRVEAFEPRSLDDIAAQVQRIGQLAGTQGVADAEAARFRRELADLRARFAAAAPVTVFYQVAANPYFTVGGSHVITELLQVCGGENVFADLPEVAPAVSLEAVLRRDPDVIVASSGSPGDWRDAWRRWPFVTAVARDALFTVDPDLLNRSTMRIVAGGRALCDALEQARGRLSAG